METPLWVQMWEMKSAHVVVFSLLLILIILIMVFRDRISKRKRSLDLLRYAILAVSFVYVGLILKAQPTSTNVIILFTGARQLEFPIELYLMEPFIFLSFVFMAVTLLVWGRGVYCGWLCPYGAMLELVNTLYRGLFKRGGLSLPRKVHGKLIYLKYIILLVLLGVSVYSFVLAEYLVEVEPFRTFVLKLNREWPFVLYFLILTVGSVILYRAFCRYICPLGAALGLPSLLKRIPLIKIKRYGLCGTCKICPRVCAPEAIGADGLIDGGECLACFDCQVNFWDEDVCPQLIKQKKEVTSQ